MREVASGFRGGVIDTITITVVKPLVVGDVGEITVKGDFNGLPCGSPRATTRKQGGIADDLKAVVIDQSGSDEVLHSGNPFHGGGSCPLLMILL